jgi:hypothetical protein
MTRVLTKLRIDEVSACDRGAGEGTKIVLMKRDTGRPLRENSFNHIMAKMADAADDGGDDGGGGDITNHPVVQAARLLVASGKFGDHGQALDFLLNKPSGQALLTRLKAADKPAKESRMPDNLAKIAKDIGIVRVAKAIVDEQRSYGISESEFVGLVTEHAKRLHPNLTGAQAFAKLYAAEPSVWQACAVLKAMPFIAADTPLMVGGVDAVREANDATEQSKAYAQLQQIGRDRWPTASEAQQFANAMTDPKNAVLAAKAHVRPRPTTSYEFPR